jgi:Winged helix DNA-binding domain
VPARPSARPAASATWGQVIALRLARHHLATRTTSDHLVDVAREMVGLHAQVMSAAELQLAARVDGIKPADVQDALWSQRALVKAWSMRGTLHLLVPDDLAAFVAAAATRERWTEEVWLRFYQLTTDVMERVTEAVGDLLSDKPMTRAALADGVAERLGDPEMAARLRSGWGTYLGAPAQRGLLIFGPSEGRNVTFVRPSAWLGRPIARDERKNAPEPVDALAGLIGRFLYAFPGSSRDMVVRWWGAQRAGLITEAGARLGDAITVVEVDGRKTWVRKEDVAAVTSAEPFRGVRLLPGFDPFVNELPRRTDELLPVVHHERIYRTAGWVTPVVIVDGAVAGTWELESGKRGGIAVQPYGEWRGGVHAELRSEADRLAAFLDRPLSVTVAAPLAAG